MVANPSLQWLASTHSFERASGATADPARSGYGFGAIRTDQVLRETLPPTSLGSRLKHRSDRQEGLGWKPRQRPERRLHRFARRSAEQAIHQNCLNRRSGTARIVGSKPLLIWRHPS